MNASRRKARRMSRVIFYFLLLTNGVSAYADEFSLSSTDIAAGKVIAQKHVYNDYGCAGGNLSPALEWKNPPAGTRSFALTVFDPDAPTGHGWLHWMVVNIPASAHALVQNAGSADGKRLPAGGVQIKTDFGTLGYGGPCPPKGHGIHHYVFTLSALPTETLTLPANVSAAQRMKIIESSRLSAATFTAIYQR